MRLKQQLDEIGYGLQRGWDLATRHSYSFLKHATPTKLRNLALVQSEMMLRRCEVKGYPYEIILDITNRCNLRCPLCVTGQRLNQRPHGRMEMEDFRRIVDELAPYLFKVRLHSWGEPFLHDRLLEMITYLTRKNVGSEVSSNFNPFRPEDAPALVASGLELLVISLDGATEEVYRKYRVGGNFPRVLDNVRALVRERRRQGARLPVIEIQFLLMKHNVHQRREMAELARELGADRWRPFPVAINARDAGQRAEWLPEDRALTRYRPENFEDKVYSTRHVCPWLWRSAVINWDGTVSPCCVYEGPKSELGTGVFSSGFVAVWNSEPYRRARSVFASGGGRGSAAGGATICHRCRGLPKAFDPNQKGVY